MSWQEATHLLDSLAGGVGGGALLFTTNPGLEDLVAGELCERVAPLGISAGQITIEQKPFGFGGHVLALLPRADAEVIAAAMGMRSVHHVLQPLYGFELSATEPVEGIFAEMRARGVPQLEAEAVRSFRITTRRSGEHDFTSIDVQRRAGAAIVERYGLAVELIDFDCEIRVDVVGDRCLVGVQLTRRALSLRLQRLHSPRAALKSNVAYGLLRLARLSRERILDPFCGSCTIPIEAAQVYPDLQISASDYSERAIEGARHNLAAAGLTERVELACRNVTELADVHPEGSFDAVITNPPFGIHLGRGMNFLTFYGHFLEAAAHVLRPGGRLVFLAWKRGVIDRANRPMARFARRHVRVVETGGIYPRMYVLERRRNS